MLEKSKCYVYLSLATCLSIRLFFVLFSAWGALVRGVGSKASILWIGYASDIKMLCIFELATCLSIWLFLVFSTPWGALRRGLGSEAFFLSVGYAWKFKVLCIFELATCLCIRPFLVFSSAWGAMGRGLGSEASFLWVGYAWKKKCFVYLSWLLDFVFGYFLYCLVHEELWEEALDPRPLSCTWVMLENQNVYLSWLLDFALAILEAI